MSQQSFFRRVVSLSIILGLAAGSAWAETGPTGHQPLEEVVVFTAHEYGFAGPERIHAGMTTVRIVNQGHDVHQIQLLRLQNGKTAEDFRKAVATNGRLPDWIKFAGGPNAIDPGKDAVATMTLLEGDYVLVCFIPTKDGVPHMALGMQKALRVKGGKPTLVSKPESAITITQADYRLTLSSPVTAGTHTFRVVNRGTQPHEVVVVKLHPGVSAQAFAAILEPGTAGPLPGSTTGGIVGVESGESGYFTAHFDVGRYALICFFPDPVTGKAHFMHGMSTEFTVQ